MRSITRYGALFLLLSATRLEAQGPAPVVRRLTLDSATTLAAPAGEVVGIVKAGVRLAEGAGAQPRSIF